MSAPEWGTSPLVSTAQDIAFLRRGMAAERLELRQRGRTSDELAWTELQNRLYAERHPLVKDFIKLVTTGGVTPEPFRRWGNAQPAEWRLPYRALRTPRLQSFMPPSVNTPPERQGWKIYDTTSGHLAYDAQSAQERLQRHSYLYVGVGAVVIESDAADDLTEYPPLDLATFAHALGTFLVDRGLVEAPEPA